MTPNRTTFLACLVALAGCGRGDEFTMSADQKATLQGADQIALFSLQPGNPEDGAADNFHGYEVLGRITLKGAERERIVEAFLRAADESDGTVASCFELRHGIRAIRNSETLDFVICFECRHAHAYSGDAEAGVITITDSQLSTFNESLKDAGIPLAPPPFTESDSSGDEVEVTESETKAE